ncbi:glycosyltransferase [Sphingobium sp. MI1205]|uniref:glycosyltransferase n=1 Tax=Sphingobium sp. MI1205 TaxID=407020 RepID=UPI0007705A1B|nr:glycosyltransferase [Sphingobium sp. MI1205]AMK18960.1 family 2 glycosyl transferase [Sphingobium sp. MI1205]
MEKGDWAEASRLFEHALSLRPDRVELQVQHGHALKEMGRTDEALASYASASGSDDGLYHLGLLRVQSGDRYGGVEAWARLLERTPDHDAALLALTRYGLAHLLPRTTMNRLRMEHKDSLLRHIGALSSLVKRAQTLLQEDISRYDEIRPNLMLPAPEVDTSARAQIIIDAGQSQPAFVRATLLSLIGCTHSAWTAVVVASSEICDHPVASLADIDTRIGFVLPGAELEPSQGVAQLYISAGTTLHADALTWVIGLLSTQAAACMTDWDYCVANWDEPVRHFDPQFHGVFDLDWLLTTDFPPPLVAVRPDLADLRPRGPEQRRELLASISMSAGDVAHIPIPLASVSRIPGRAEAARQLGQDALIWSLQPAGFPPVAGPVIHGKLQIVDRPGRTPLTCGGKEGKEAVRVIIPTRDCADLLEPMVESLIAHADKTDLLRLTIVDNRSQEEATARLLSRLGRKDGIDIVSFDRPFNWSEINNAVAEGTSEELLVFANNDVAMLTPRWDRHLRAQLGRSDVGIVGSRLLYPDGSVQHAGMLMGLADGSPRHETGKDADDITSRLDRVRAVPAVTGAFMGVRREVFQRLGGFDAGQFAIAYNDVDLCLAARAVGLKVLYDPGIELIHYESRTRGFNDNRLKIAWDQGELRSLYEKWGEALLRNPHVSPWWTPTAPFMSIEAGRRDRVLDWMTSTAMGRQG